VRRQKTGKGERHIPLNEAAIAAFESLRPGAKRSGVPFLNSKGTPMTTHRDWFDPAVEEARVQDYTWHKNRHTFASRLAMAGVDIRTIAQLMGHATIQMSMRYAHLSPDHNQAAVDRLVVFGIKRTPNRTPEKQQSVSPL
jgi:integrase